MTWSRFDDGYDEHETIEEAWFAFPPNPVGLHVLATTACNRWLSDGVIRPRWLNAMIPDRKDRERVLAYMVEHGLLDLLPAGEARAAEDKDGWPATVGPFDEPRYVVHDFLQRHECAANVKARRAKDAARKRRGRAADSAENPPAVRVDVQPDGAQTPGGVTPPVRLAGGSAPARPHPTPPHPDPREGVGNARADQPTVVADVVAVLGQCPRLHVDQVGVENAVGAWPGRDAVRAARTVVTWATDPAFRSTNAAKLLGDALSKQTVERVAARDEKKARDARRLASLHSLTGGTP